MADLYGQLNQITEYETYEGKESSTAKVTVDNAENTIKVDIKTDSDWFSQAIQTKLNLLDYPDTELPGKFVTAVTQENGQIDVIKAEPTIDDIINLRSTINSKQDILGFKGEYDKQTNPVITNDYLEDRIEPLEGALHFIGVTNIQTGETFEDAVNRLYAEAHITTKSHGDLVIIDGEQYYYIVNEEHPEGYWKPSGMKDVYAIKGQIADSDINASANIAQSKISGLVSQLDTIDTTLLNHTDKLSERPAMEVDTSSHCINLTFN